MPTLIDSLTIEVDVTTLLEDSAGLVVDVFTNRISDSVQVDVMVDTPLNDSVLLSLAVMGTALGVALAQGTIEPAGTVEFL